LNEAHRLKLLKDHSNSAKALIDAARDFPSIVPLLADKLDISLPADIRAHRDFKIETEARYLFLQSLRFSIDIFHSQGFLNHLKALFTFYLIFMYSGLCLSGKITPRGSSRP
jgi:hypothetical protein